MRVSVAYARPERQWVVEVELETGASIQDAVARSGLLALCPELRGLPALELGVFHRRRAPTSPARAGDRIEIYRPLQVDPKQARRLRAARKAPPAALHTPTAQDGGSQDRPQGRPQGGSK